MKTTTLRISFYCLILISGFSARSRAQEGLSPVDQDAMKLAKELTDKGTKMFAAGDGAGLAAQYMEDGEIVEKKVESIGPASITIHRGAEAIRKLYENAPSLIKLNLTNEVHFARHVTPDTLYITGDLLMSEEGTTNRLPFSQVRKKVGDSWKIVSLELSLKK